MSEQLMHKVRITSDTVLSIVRGIFEDKDVNGVIGDTDAPQEWQGRTITDVMNVEYYTFKHRPVSSEAIVAEKIRAGEPVNRMEGMNRSFCLVSAEVERLFSKDVDMATVTTTLEYWLQTSKIKLLEDLIESCNISLSGMRIPVDFGNGNIRKAVIIFDKPVVTDIQSAMPCGEMAVCEVGVNMMLYPDITSYSDYTVAFSWSSADGAVKTETVPLSSFSFVNTMTQKAVPYAAQTRRVGNINLSCANSFVLVFEGHNNEFINYITDKTLESGLNPLITADNNESFLMTVTRRDKKYTHDIIIKDHQVVVNADTGNETHTLSLVTRG